MYEIIDEFSNFDIKKKVVSKKKIFKPKYVFYLGRNDTFPTNLYHENDIFSVIKYDNYQDIISDIRKTYNDEQSIHEQFVLDVKRSILSINGHKVKNITRINNYIDYTYLKKKHELELLCTQSIFASIIEWLYNSIPDGYYVGELDSTKNNSKAKIHINHNNIHITKKLRVFFISDEGDAKTYRNIQINISVNDYLKSNTVDYELKFYSIKNN